MATHTPLLHMNGSGKNNLTQQLEDLYLAIGEAMVLAGKCRPHMRDYYPYPDAEARFKAARDRVDAWQQRLADIREDIENDVKEIM